ncbi:MAG: YdcF family protein [Rhodospirillales bacterium]|nr:YdcF family protein [Rhodospirillales bacterium]
MFFALSKIFWFFVNPGNLLLVVLCLGAGFLWTRWRRLGRWLISAVATTGFILAVFPFGSWLFGALEDRFPPLKDLPAQVDGIVVAGGIVDPAMTFDRGQTSIGGAAERLFEMAVLAKRYPQAKLLFSGGSGSLLEQDKKEAVAVVPLFRQLGIDPGRVIFESQSRNTAENASFSYRAAKPKEGETWILITSAFHMPRTIGSFRKAGWQVTPYPVDYNTRRNAVTPLQFNFSYGLGSLGSAMHEYLGLFFYWTNGKTDELFPGPRR